MNSLDIKDKQSQLAVRCKEIVELAKSEVRSLTTEETQEIDSNKAEIEKLNDELRALEESLATEERAEENEENTEENTEETPQNGSEEPQENTENKRNITKMEKKSFSLVKELRSAYENKTQVNLAELRAYTVTDEGVDVVQTDIYDIWEPLRAKSIMSEAGVQMLTGIKDNVQIPLMSGTSVNWAGETDAAGDGSGAFTSKVLTPKRLTAKVPVSLQLLAQDNLAIESKIRADIYKAIQDKIEETMFSDAAATATSPAGILNGLTINLVTDFAGITALEANIESANINGGCKYIVAPSAKADLRNMPKSAKSTQLVMESGEIDGTEVISTTHVKGSNVIYGDFSNIVFAAWDNVTLDVVRDVASLANGVVTIVVNAFVDFAVIRPEGITACKTK